MFCPKCGTNVDEGTKICPKCGLEFEKINNADHSNLSEHVVDNTVSNSEVKATTSPRTIMRIVYFGLAAVILIMFFLAAGSITAGGNEIMDIQSVGGKTLEEAYYQELGNIYAGYAMIARAMGVFFAAVLAWLGLKS